MRACITLGEIGVIIGCGTDIASALTTARDAGFDGVSVDVEPDSLDQPPGSLGRLSELPFSFPPEVTRLLSDVHARRNLSGFGVAATVARLAGDFGLACESLNYARIARSSELGGASDSTRRSAVAFVGDLIRDAARLGFRAVDLHHGFDPTDLSGPRGSDDALRNELESVAELLPVAEDEGIELRITPIRSEALATRNLVDRLNSPSLSVSGFLVHGAGFDVDFLRTLAYRLGAISVFPQGPSDEFAAARAALSDIGFDGPVFTGRQLFGEYPSTVREARDSIRLALGI